MEAAAEKSQLNIDSSSLERTPFASVTSVVWNEKMHDVTRGGTGKNEGGQQCLVLISKPLKTRGIKGCSSGLPDASILYQPQLKQEKPVKRLKCTVQLLFCNCLRILVLQSSFLESAHRHATNKPKYCQLF